MVRGVMGRVLLALLVLPAALGGQAVVGTVTEGGSDRPVVGAMVRLYGEGGPAGSLYLTAVDGRYRLRAPGPGSYWLQVERIGFVRFREGPVALGPDQTVELDLDVPADPVRLEGLDVEAAGRRCSLGSEEGDQTQLVWDEARKALAAATWTQRAIGLRFDVEQRVRTLDPRGWTVTDEERSRLETVGGNSVRSLPPDDLARGGYVREIEGLVHYYGPDAEALLSDVFLETHCFQLVPGPDDEPGLVGLSFEPVPERDTTDIAGVLLVDRATARLARVEFHYTGLQNAVGRDQARGMVRFLELGDGRWVIREWYIRAPVLVLARSVGAGGQLVERLEVGSVREFGSRVLSVQGPEGISWSADQPVGDLRGVVYDSIRERRLSGAEVRLAGRGWRTTTDGEGRWALEEVPPGSYRVSFSHPALDSLGVEPAWREASVEAGGVTQLRLAVPPLGRLLALPCPEPRGGVVVGFVRDGVGRALPGVEVEATTASGEDEARFQGVTDDDGTFRICGLPPDREVLVEAFLGPIASSRGAVRTVEGMAVRVDLRVAAATEIRTGVEGDATRPALEGRVVELGTGEPLDGVEVVLLRRDGSQAARRISGADGGFRLLPQAVGTYRLRAGHLGFASVEEEVEVVRGGDRVEIRLAAEAVAVQGMVVEVEARSRRLELAGFYDRRAQGMGLLFDRHELGAMNLTRTGDIVHRVGGLAALPQTTRGAMDANRRFLMFRRAARGSGCMPAIFVDGNRIREGGRWSSAMPSLDELIPADEVEGMELYEGPASTPARFSSMGGACGVIVIWSRSPEGE